MTTPTFDELIQPQTVDAHRAAMQAAGEAVGQDYSALPPLDMNRTLALQATPTAMSTRDTLINEAIRGGLKDWAEGDWLELLAENVFGLEGGRFPETHARTTVTFTNAGSGEWHFNPGEQIIKSEVTGRAYFNESAFSLFPTGDPEGRDVVDVVVVAEEPGSDWNAAANTLTIMQPAIDDVTLTNAQAAIATDEETDAQLRTRCDDALGALSPDGAVNAYRDVARNAYVLPDGTYVYTHKPEDYAGAASLGITRVQVVEHSPDMGDVSVYLATAAGIPSVDYVNAIHALILQWARPNGVAYLGTFAATLVTINIAYTAVYRTRYGVTEAELTEFVDDALSAFFVDEERNPLGGVIGIVAAPDGVLVSDELRAIISQAQGSPDAPAPIVKVSSIAPSGDTTLAPGELAVKGTVTPTFTAIP